MKTFKELLCNKSAELYGTSSRWMDILEPMEPVQRYGGVYVFELDSRFFRCLDDDGWLCDNALEVFPHEVTTIEYKLHKKVG